MKLKAELKERSYAKSAREVKSEALECSEKEEQMVVSNTFSN